ncbi:hypothetical protein PISL3812_08758 [Talaromyces islandicus]|uniref:FAD-binding domain-containing protein n=1 Tax=Talaromyces islandicus TaxID=28573 RepID=A0A0U1M801_TALIS|nr:hypothetical protein PISL3812_08758 [Talaromyces islandicus]
MGRGLNVGLADAINLGWKLTATVRRERNPDGALLGLKLLDTYNKELHPIAAWGLDWTRAQSKATSLLGVLGFELSDSSRLGYKLEEGCELLFDFEKNVSLKYLVVSQKYERLVDYVALDGNDRRDLCALLIRPDRVVV